MEITDLIFFASAEEFRNWLKENHAVKQEIWAGFYKTGTGKPSMTWSESVDQALCFGWIDGIRKSIDDESYCMRFTPRKPNSNWSTVNINKIEELTAKGLMSPAGIAAFEKRKPEKSGIYSFEREAASFSPDFEKQFKANTAAWNYFSSAAPSYRKTATYWIISAKQEATKLNRLIKLIEACAEGRRLF